MYKKSYTTQMSSDITPEEKEIAAKAIKLFELCENKINIANKYLDIIYTPFKNNSDISPEQIIKFRASLRTYRDNVIDKFNDLKKQGFDCVVIMQNFGSDTQTTKLVKSFISGISELEDNVNKFSKLFDNLEDKDFVSKVIEVITSIKGNNEQIKEIISDRIKKHIQENILATDWVDGLSKKLDINMVKQKPLIMELEENQQKTINQYLKKDED